jgi:hypothetical protein
MSVFMDFQSYETFFLCHFLIKILFLPDSIDQYARHPKHTSLLPKTLNCGQKKFYDFAPKDGALTLLIMTLSVTFQMDFYKMIVFIDCQSYNTFSL